MKRVNILTHNSRNEYVQSAGLFSVNLVLFRRRYAKRKERTCPMNRKDTRLIYEGTPFARHRVVSPRNKLNKYTT